MDPLHAWLNAIEKVIALCSMLTVESWAALGIDSVVLVTQLRGVLDRLNDLLEETSSEPELPRTYCRWRRYRVEFPREERCSDTADGAEGFHLVRVRVFWKVIPRDVKSDSDSDVPDQV